MNVYGNRGGVSMKFCAFSDCSFRFRKGLTRISFCSWLSVLGVVVVISICVGTLRLIMHESKKNCLGYPFIYVTVHHEVKNILKYSRNGCLISKSVLFNGPLDSHTQFRSIALAEYQGQESLFVADASDKGSKVLLYRKCKHGDNWCYISTPVSTSVSHGVEHTYGLCFDSMGNLYVSFQHTNCVLRFTRDSFFPMDINPQLEHSSNHLRYYDGTFIQFGEPSGSHHDKKQQGIRSIISVHDDIWIANEFLEGVVVANSVTGAITGIIAVRKPIGLFYDEFMNAVYVSSKDAHFGGAVYAIDVSSRTLLPDSFRTPDLLHPTGIAVHDGTLFVAEQSHNCVHSFDIKLHKYLGVVVPSIPGAPINNFPSWQTFRSSQEGDATKEAYVSQLLEELDSAETIDAILLLVDEIPAIRLSVDRSIRICTADSHDAILASHFVHRLAQVLMNQKLSHEKNELEFDRRFEQLVEVVELNLSSMSVIPLTRYLWGITVVGISDSDHIKTVFEAYNQRVESYDILDVPNEDVTIQTTEELAMMLWTVGCVKETFKWTNIPLVTAILQRLTVYNYKHSTLNGLRSGLLARVLWSTAVHNVFSHDLYIHAVYSILFRHSIEELSSTSAVTLLWASHLFRTSNQKWTEKVINRIVLDIVDDNGNVALPLFPMLSDALCSIYQSSVFVDTTNLTGGNETSEHAGTTNREQHDSIQSVIEDTFTVDDIVRIRCLVERIARWMQPRVHQAMESHTVSASALATIIKLLVVTNTLHGDVYDKYLQYIGAAVEGNKSPQLRLTAAAQTLEVMARWGHKNHEHDPAKSNRNRSRDTDSSDDWCAEACTATAADCTSSVPQATTPTTTDNATTDSKPAWNWASILAAGEVRGGTWPLASDRVSTSARDVFRTCWLQGSSFRDFLTADGDSNIEYSEWAPLSDVSSVVTEDLARLEFTHFRTFKYSHPRKLMVGSQRAAVQQTQYLCLGRADVNAGAHVSHSLDNLSAISLNRGIILTVSTFENIPFCDCFKLLQYWSFDESELDVVEPVQQSPSCVVRSACHVHFIKGTVLKGQIIGGVKSELAQRSSLWSKYVKERATRSAPLGENRPSVQEVSAPCEQDHHDHVKAPSAAANVTEAVAVLNVQHRAHLLGQLACKVSMSSVENWRNCTDPTIIVEAHAALLVLGRFPLSQSRITIERMEQTLEDVTRPHLSALSAHRLGLLLVVSLAFHRATSSSSLLSNSEQWALRTALFVRDIANELDKKLRNVQSPLRHVEAAALLADVFASIANFIPGKMPDPVNKDVCAQDSDGCNGDHCLYASTTTVFSVFPVDFLSTVSTPALIHILASSLGAYHWTQKNMCSQLLKRAWDELVGRDLTPGEKDTVKFSALEEKAQENTQLLGSWAALLSESGLDLMPRYARLHRLMTVKRASCTADDLIIYLDLLQAVRKQHTHGIKVFNDSCQRVNGNDGEHVQTSIEGRVATISKAFVQQIQQPDPQSTGSQGFDEMTPNLAFSLERVTHWIASMQSFLELDWVDASLLELCVDQVNTFSSQSFGPTVPNTGQIFSELAFRLGVLVETVKVYEDLNNQKHNQKHNLRELSKSFLSRLFHRN